MASKNAISGKPNKDDDSEDTKLLREIATCLFNVNGQVSREDVIREIVNNHPEELQDRVSTKMIDNILDDFKR